MIYSIAFSALFAELTARLTSLNDQLLSGMNGMAVALIGWMRHNVLQERMAAPASQQIWRCYQHASSSGGGSLV